MPYTPMVHFNSSGKYWDLCILCGRGAVGCCDIKLVTCPNCLKIYVDKDIAKMK